MGCCYNDMIIGPGLPINGGGGGIVDRTKYVERDLPITIDNYVELGKFGNLEALPLMAPIDLQVAVSDSGISISKRFLIVSGPDVQVGEWLIAYPIAASVGADDFDLDVLIQGSELFLRYRRTTGSTAGIIKTTIFYDGVSAFTALSGTGTVIEIPPIFLKTTAMTQRSNELYVIGKIRGKNSLILESTTVQGAYTEFRSQDRLYIIGGRPIDMAGSKFYAGEMYGNTAAGIKIFDNSSNLGINVIPGGSVGVGNTDPLSALDITQSTIDRSALRIRSGVAPTTPNIGDIWHDSNGLNFQISAVESKKFTPENLVYVHSPDDFPAPDGNGKIHIESRHYVIMKSIELDGNLGYKGFYIDSGFSPRITGYKTITYKNQNPGVDALFQSADVGGALMILDNLNLYSDGSGRLFDLSSSQTDGFLILNTVAAGGFNTLGTVEGLSYFGFIVNYIQCGITGGLTFVDNNAVVLQSHRFNEWFNAPVTFVSITGTQKSVQINNNFFEPQSNETVLYLAPTMTTTGGAVVGNAFDIGQGGAVFAPGSLLQSDIYWTFDGNTNLGNSTALGDMSVRGNIDFSFVDVTDVPIPVTATWSDQVERFILDTKIEYDTQTANFTVGQILGGLSGGSGLIIADDDRGTSGTLTLNNASGPFVPGDQITDPLGGSALISVASAAIPAPISGRLRYIGLEPVQVHVTASAQLRPSTGTNVPLATYIAKNSTPIDKSEAQSLISSSAVRSIFCQAIVSLATGDYIELYVNNKDTTANIYVEAASLIATKI